LLTARLKCRIKGNEELLVPFKTVLEQKLAEAQRSKAKQIDSNPLGTCIFAANQTKNGRNLQNGGGAGS